MRFEWFLNPVRLGVKSLALHKLRSLLTILGVVFGVGSVIVMLGIGEGIRHDAVQRIEELGATNIIVRSVRPTGASAAAEGGGATRYGLTTQDLQRVVSSIPTVVSATPTRDHRRDLHYQDRKVEGRVVGVTAEYLELSDLRLRQGRFFSPLDLERVASVAVLGAQTAEILFPVDDPIGKSIRIGEDQYYQVVGVIHPRASSPRIGTDLPAEDYNRDVYIPFTTDQVRFGETINFDRTGTQPPEKLDIRQITFGVSEPAYVKQTAEIIDATLRQHRRRQDTVMTVPLDLLERAEQTQRMFTLVLSAIASISLVVGGIGIMNIMLATVTERTREIGVRRALGARRRDIIYQFLIETVVLTGTGGILGVVLGITMAHVVTFTSEVPTLIRLWSPLLALVISVAIGLVFGLYPARRAAYLDPIEALRHE